MVVKLQAGHLLVDGLDLLLLDRRWHCLLVVTIGDDLFVRPEDRPSSGLAPALSDSIIEMRREGRERLELSESCHRSEGSLVHHHPTLEDDKLWSSSADEVLVDT